VAYDLNSRTVITVLQLFREKNQVHQYIAHIVHNVVKKNIQKQIGLQICSMKIKTKKRQNHKNASWYSECYWMV